MTGALHAARASTGAPLTLTAPPCTGLGPGDASGPWADLGTGLPLPVAAALVVRAGAVRLRRTALPS